MTNIIFTNSEIFNIQDDLKDALSMFNSRYKEAESYINYLQKLEKRGTQLKFGSNPNLFEINREFLKISRANGYLILYNLVESTIYEATTGLYKHLEYNVSEVDNLIDDLKVFIFKGIQNSTQDNLKSFKESLTLDFRNSIFQICFDKRKIKKMFSGNLDAKKIREFTEDHGISLTLDDESNQGGRLKYIKDTRNDLAHGSASFSSKGEVSAETLNSLCRETGYYLRGVILSINTFLNEQKYHKLII
ncbi:MAE_28990/MAE_18760 family HEPN-like nuclease [Acinetobacter sp. MB5]|uniref:MAE_28990/MAE_18760 family HEPN-like nuclease n=1 Tax=Acinetobacter sp. MB5 TaxID=2069438 RepID=UPI000DD07281|nr:MAE_28990/MAE_18760 family HEPN-like nuclease [Acinetobacter sp. MB5]